MTKRKRKPLWLAQLHMWRYLHAAVPITLAARCADEKPPPDSLQGGLGEGMRTSARPASALEAFERLKGIRSPL